MGLVALHTFSRIPALSWADEVDDDAGAFLSDAWGWDGFWGARHVTGLYRGAILFDVSVYIYNLVGKGNYA